MNKKAVEMSLNTIIIIVIVLLILLIMTFLLTNGFQNFAQTTSCKIKEGDYECRPICADAYPTPAWGSCPEKGHVCCGPPLYNTN